MDILFAERLGGLTVVQIKAALASASDDARLVDTDWYKAQTRCADMEQIGLSARDMAHVLTELARLAAESQPRRRLKMARLVMAFAQTYTDCVSLFCLERGRSEQLAIPGTLNEAIQACISVAVTQQLYWLAEAFTNIELGLEGDQASMQAGLSSLEAAIARRQRPSGDTDDSHEGRSRSLAAGQQAARRLMNA